MGERMFDSAPGRVPLTECQPLNSCQQLDTLLRNHIQLERSGTDRFFSYYHFIYIYMDYFIAFLKYFTDVRVKKCPFCTQQWLKTTFEWPKVVSEVSFPRFWGVLWGGLFSGIFRFGDQKCRFRDIAISAFLRKIEKTVFFLVFLKLLEILI